MGVHFIEADLHLLDSAVFEKHGAFQVLHEPVGFYLVEELVQQTFNKLDLELGLLVVRVLVEQNFDFEQFLQLFWVDGRHSVRYFVDYCANRGFVARVILILKRGPVSRVVEHTILEKLNQVFLT